MIKTKVPMLNNPQSLLDLSNYIYIGAAVLAVIATFSIVYFGNRVASLKDAELKAYQRGADARIFEANQKTAEANAEAAEARRLAEEANGRANETARQTASLQQQNLLLQARQGGVETRQANVEGSLTQINSRHRSVAFTPQDIVLSKQFRGESIEIWGNGGDVDAPGITGTFHNAIGSFIPIINSTIMGPSPSHPLSQRGVHVHYSPSPKAQALAIFLKAFFGRNKIDCDIAPFDTLDSIFERQMRGGTVLVYLGPTD